MIKSIVALALALVALLIVFSPRSRAAETNIISLTEDNTVSIRSEITDTTVGELQKDLNRLVEKRGTKDYTIYLVLDSPGGSIDAGLSFIEYAKTIKNVQTVTLFAASMASAIVEALPGQRNIVSTGTLMFHRAYGGIEGQFEDGELESRLVFYKRLVRDMEQTNASRMSMPLPTYKEKVKNELWIYGSDAVEAKAADKVVSVSCSTGLVKREKIETFSFMGFPIEVKFSACPVVRGGEVIEEEQTDLYNKYLQNRLKSAK